MMTETEIRVEKRRIERSIPHKRKNISKDWRQERFKNLKQHNLAEREKKRGRFRNAAWWEKDCLMRVMLGKRGLENTILDLMLKRWDFFLETRKYLKYYIVTWSDLFLEGLSYYCGGNGLEEGRTIGREAYFSNPGEKMLAKTGEIERKEPIFLK